MLNWRPVGSSAGAVSLDVRKVLSEPANRLDRWMAGIYTELTMLPMIETSPEPDVYLFLSIGLKTVYRPCSQPPFRVSNAILRSRGRIPVCTLGATQPATVRLPLHGWRSRSVQQCSRAVRSLSFS